ncbi:MAG: hypothetical protein DGJ47_000401 [Rickettsiaceae bacterium]
MEKNIVKKEHTLPAKKKKKCSWLLKIIAFIFIIVALLIGFSQLYSNLWTDIQDSDKKISESTTSLLDDVEQNDSENNFDSEPKNDDPTPETESLVKEQISPEEEPITTEQVHDKEFTVGPEPPLPSFAPEIDEALEENINPYQYEDDLEESTNSLKSFNISEEKFNTYKGYLINATKLLIKIEHDIDFNKELDKLQNTNHPENIQEILRALEEYNTEKQNYLNNEEVIHPFNYDFIDKFITITRVSKSDKQKLLEQRKKVISYLPELIEYFNSDELQKQL